LFDQIYKSDYDYIAGGGGNDTSKNYGEMLPADVEHKVV
jgi:hypothetical protein